MTRKKRMVPYMIGFDRRRKLVRKGKYLLKQDKRDFLVCVSSPICINSKI